MSDLEVMLDDFHDERNCRGSIPHPVTVAFSDLALNASETCPAFSQLTRTENRMKSIIHKIIMRN